MRAGFAVSLAVDGGSVTEGPDLAWRARIVLLQLLAGVLALVALTMIARRYLL